MSNLTEGLARELKKGDTLYHNILVFTDPESGEETLATGRVAGKLREHEIYGYCLPVELMYAVTKGTVIEVCSYTQSLWRTTKEKEVVSRVRRPARVVQEEEPEEEQAPVRVRRTRAR